MKTKSLKISLILLTLSLSSCKYTPEKVTPVFPDFSKQTANLFRVKSAKPLEFEVAEQGVPFDEIARRTIQKEMEPLVCFPISQVQEMRRAWENQKKDRATARSIEVHSAVDANTDSEGDATTRQVRMLNQP
jgi:hypothetical protein